MNKIVYASPAGSDSNGGTSWTDSFLTVAKAITTLNSIGGGLIRVAPNTQTCSTSGAGLWIRGVNDIGRGGPGWVDASASLVIEFVGDTAVNLTIAPQSYLAPGGGAASFTGSVLEIHGTLQGITIYNLNAVSANETIPTVRLGLSSPLDPIVPAYIATTTYNVNDYVVYSGNTYQSIVGSNTGNQPDISPTQWRLVQSTVYSPSTTYNQDAIVLYSGNSYISMVSSNTGHQPDISPTQWQPLRPTVNDGLAQSITALLRFVNCTFQRNGASVGPAVDEGFAFWVWWEQCVLSHFFAVEGNDFLNCSIRSLQGPSPSIGSTETYLQQFSDCRHEGAGMYIEGAGAGTYMDNCFGENMVMPVWHGVGGATIIGRRVQASDSPDGIVLQNDGSGLCIAEDCGNTQGQFIKRTTAAEPMLGTAGQFGTYLACQHDTGRSTGGLSTGLYPNVALNLAGGATPTWVTGPFGEPASAQLARVNGGYIFGGSGQNFTINPGDYVAWGFWIRFTSAPNSQGIWFTNQGSASMEVYTGFPVHGGSTGNQTLTVFPDPHFGFSWYPAAPVATGEWIWMFGWLRVVSTNPGAGLQISGGATSPSQIARPWLISIPASDGLTDAQVYRMALHSVSTPNA